MKIGYFTDLHFRQVVPGTSACHGRECRKMAEILDWCLRDFKKQGVDLIICTGDLVDEPISPEVEKDLLTIRNLIQGIFISTPTIVIPGNHDPDPDAFYHIFTQPSKTMQIENCEFITFFEDVCQEGELAPERMSSSLNTMRNLLIKNPVEVKHTFFIQHYLIYPEYNEEYPYNYQNALVIQEIMEMSPRKIFSISGHYHPGFSVTQHNGVSYFCGMAMCENPFPYYILDTDADEIIIREYKC